MQTHITTSATQPTLIFLHIPKTAGSTLHSILNRRYGRTAVHNVFASSYAQEGVQALIAMPEARKREIRLLKGHMPFGLHQFLPQPSTYFTMLRHPVRRVVSNYFYIQRDPNNRLREIILRDRMSLGDFIRSGVSVGVNNGQVRWLAGELHACGFNEGGYPLLEAAKRNIEAHFSLVGLTERFDETMLALRRLLGWSAYPWYAKENLRRGRHPQAAEVSRADLRIVEEYNTLDLELYEYATRRFDELVREMDLGAEVEWFRRWNRVYGYVRDPLAILYR